jgi:hypothetical protein
MMQTKVCHCSEPPAITFYSSNCLALALDLIDTLNIKDTRYRLQKIENAYGPTFEWVWTDPDIAFASWLEDGTGVYWISGKPGSGKSTLMKYIFNKYQHVNFTNHAVSHQTKVAAGFFFHDRGSHIQKSFEGLLHSILHQILSSELRLANEVSHIYLRRTQGNRAQWPIEDLEEALECILEQDKVPVNVLLFLDALDEYGGRPEFIASFIKRVADPSRNSATRVKICFSSRLWNVFIDQFQSGPGFKIHERTQGDTLTYINGKFNSNPSMTQLLLRNTENQDSEILALTSSLINRAEGVFLWLKLVVDDLLIACTDGATVPELLGILASFPKELEDLYRQLVQRIPKEFRLESYAMLEIVLRSGKPMRPHDFWLAVECAPCQTLEACVAKIPMKAYLPASDWAKALKDLHPARYESLYISSDAEPSEESRRQRRLKSRCGGLIELVPSSEGQVLQFMHQTVKDFVGKPGFRQLITNEDNDSKENGYSFLAKYGLAQLATERRRFFIPFYMSLPEDAPKLPNWFAYLFYASRAESTTGTSQKYLLDAASEAFRGACNEHDVYGMFSSPLSFGVVANLQLYVEETLGGTTHSPHGSTIGYDFTSHVPSLLHNVVRMTSRPELFMPKKLLTSKWEPPKRIEYDLAYDDIDIVFDDLTNMTNILLNHGANRDSLYQGMTPFKLLFHELNAEDRGTYCSLPANVANVAEAFLKHGQDPNTPFLRRLCFPYGAHWTRCGCERSELCWPLHVAKSKLAHVLIEHGVDVNTLNGKGLTALDVVIQAASALVDEYSSNSQREEVYSLTKMLLDHGACVTKASAYDLPRFLAALSNHKYYPLNYLVERLKKPSLLQVAPAPTALSSNSSASSKSARFKNALPRIFKRRPHL